MNQEKLCFLPLRKALTFLWLLRIPEMQKGQIFWTFLNECLQNESSDHEWNQMWKVFKKNLLKAAWSIPWAFFLLRLWISRMTRLRMTQLWASALQLFPWPFLWHDVAWCGAVACYEKGWKCRSMQKLCSWATSMKSRALLSGMYIVLNGSYLARACTCCTCDSVLLWMSWGLDHGVPPFRNNSSQRCWKWIEY